MWRWRWIGMFVWLVLGLAWPVGAQGDELVPITRENVDQVTLLAAGGWTDRFQTIDVSLGNLAYGSEPWWPAWTIAFSPDGTRFALGNDNNEVVLFDVIDDPPFIVENQVLRGHAGPVYSLAFHPDGVRLASGGSGGLVYVWDMDTGRITEQIATNPSSAVYGLAYSPDGGTLYCGTLAGLTHTTAHSPDTCRAFAEDPPTYSVTFSPDGALLAYGDTFLEGTTPGILNKLELATQRGGSERYTSSQSKLTFSADGNVLLNAGINQTAYVWRLDDLTSGPTLISEGLQALSPDGTLAAGRNLLIADTATGETLLSFESPDAHFRHDAYYANLTRDAVFSPDGTLLVTASVNGVLRFWGVPAD